MSEAQDKQIKMSELMSAFSMATDLAEGHPMEHGVKTCYISLRLADVLKLSDQERADVYYTALLQHAA